MSSVWILTSGVTRALLAGALTTSRMMVSFSSPDSVCFNHLNFQPRHLYQLLVCAVPCMKVALAVVQAVLPTGGVRAQQMMSAFLRLLVSL